MEKDELEKLFLERLEPSDDNVQEHQFSERYRNRKARIIGRRRVKLSVRRIIIPAAAVCAVAMMVAAVNIFRAPGFWGYDHSDNLELFVEDRQNGPQTLEELYKVEVPDGFEITMFSDPSGRSLDVRYSQTDGSDEIMFTQTVRSSYNTHYDNEHWEIEQCTIAGYPGIMFKGDNNNIVWDNGEYIMELYGSLTVEQLMEIAETAAPGEYDWLSVTGTDLPQTIGREFQPQIDGYEVADRQADDREITTKLTGEREITVRQSVAEAFAPLYPEDMCYAEQIQIGDMPGWLVQYWNEDDVEMYSVVLECGGYILEMSTPARYEKNSEGFYDVSAEIKRITSLAEELTVHIVNS